MNLRLIAILLISLMTGCYDSSDEDSGNYSQSDGWTENINIQEEQVSSKAVYINDKKLSPPPSPPSRLRKSFDGRQRKYAAMINRISRQYGVDPLLTHAIVSQESWYRPTVGSNAGAIGLMQLIDSTGRRYGCANRRNPECNVRAGVKYLKVLAKRYAGKGNIQTIAAGYNAGEAVADSYLNGTKLRGKNPLGRQTPNGVPVASFGYSITQKNRCSGVNVNPSWHCEGETHHYTRNVAGYYLRYKRNPQLVGLGGATAAPSSVAARRGFL